MVVHSWLALCKAGHPSDCAPHSDSRPHALRVLWAPGAPHPGLLGHPFLCPSSKVLTCPGSLCPGPLHPVPPVTFLDLKLSVSSWTPGDKNVPNLNPLYSLQPASPGLPYGMAPAAQTRTLGSPLSCPILQVPTPARAHHLPLGLHGLWLISTFSSPSPQRRAGLGHSLALWRGLHTPEPEVLAPTSRPTWCQHSPQRSTARAAPQVGSLLLLAPIFVTEM